MELLLLLFSRGHIQETPDCISKCGVVLHMLSGAELLRQSCGLCVCVCVCSWQRWIPAGQQGPERLCNIVFLQHLPLKMDFILVPQVQLEQQPTCYCGKYQTANGMYWLIQSLPCVQSIFMVVRRREGEVFRGDGREKYSLIGIIVFLSNI